MDEEEEEDELELEDIDLPDPFSTEPIPTIKPDVRSRFQINRYTRLSNLLF